MAHLLWLKQLSSCTYTGGPDPPPWKMASIIGVCRNKQLDPWKNFGTPTPLPPRFVFCCCFCLFVGGGVLMLIPVQIYSTFQGGGGVSRPPIPYSGSTFDQDLHVVCTHKGVSIKGRGENFVLTMYKQLNIHLLYRNSFIVRTHTKLGLKFLKLTCWWHLTFWPHAVDGAPSQIPTLKFFTPSTPKSHPWRDPGNRMKILFNMFSIYFCENTHKVWYKNLWNWHVNDIWPLPKVTSLTLGWNVTCILFCSSFPSIWYATWPCLNKKIWPPGHPHCPKVPPLGHDPGDRIKIPSDMFCIFHLWEHTQSLV